MKKMLTVIAVVLAVSGARAQWTPLTTGYWNVLLHLGADFNNDYLYSNGNDIATDQLAAFDGQANQMPYAGLVYDNLQGPTSGVFNSFTWTVLTNTAASNLWTPVPDRNAYIKFWHAYLWVPAQTAAVIHHTNDDDLRVWDNGAPVVTAGYTGTETAKSLALVPGLHRITIKLREGSGGDNMRVKMTAPDGSALPGVRFAASAIGFIDTLVATEITDTSVTVAVDFIAIMPPPASFVAVCDTGDHGDSLQAWVSAGAQIQNYAAAPASVSFGNLTPGTPYVVRVFATNETTWCASDALEFSSYGVEPVVFTLDADDIDGLTATAVGNMFFTGSGAATADAYLCWGTSDGGADTNAWQHVERIPALSAGTFRVPLTGLTYSTQYHYRFMAANANAEAWSPEAVVFTTRGTPVFGAVSADTATPAQLILNARIVEAGPAPATVTCYFGTSPGALAEAAAWQNVGNDTNLAHTVTGLQVGATFYYAFKIYCELDATQNWTVWSATNTVVTSGTSTWTGEGADTDWHTPENWDHGVPGPAATAILGSAATGVTLSASAAVGELLLSGADTALDTGAFTLAAATMRVNTASRLVVSGNLAVSENLHVGYETNGNSITLDPGATLVVGVNLYVGAAIGQPSLANNNTLVIRSGAHADVAGLLYVGWSNDTANSNLVDVELNGVLAVGGTSIVSQRTRDCSAYGNELRVRGLLLANGIQLGSNNGWGGGTGNLVVDGGVVTNTAATLVSYMGGSGHDLVIRNNARFVQTAGNFSIGSRTPNCRVFVLDDAECHIAGTLKLGDYGDSAIGGNILVVSNAVMNVDGGVNVGNKSSASGNSITVWQDAGRIGKLHVTGTISLGITSRDNTLLVRGGTLSAGALNTSTGSATSNDSTNNTVRVFGNTARLNLNSMNLRNRSSLLFSMDKAPGFPAIAITGNAAVAADTRVTLDATSGFTGTTLLLNSGTGNISAVPVENFDVNVGSREYELTHTDTIIKLRVWKNDTLFLLK